MIKTETSATKFKEVAGSGSGMLCAMPNGCDSLDGGLPSSSVPGRPALQPVNVLAEENTRGRGAQAPGGSTVAERATKSSSLPKVELDLSVVHRPSCSALPPRSKASDFLPSGTVGNLVQGRYDTEFKEDPREIGRGGFGVVHKAMHYLSDGLRPTRPSSCFLLPSTPAFFFSQTLSLSFSPTQSFSFFSPSLSPPLSS